MTYYKTIVTLTNGCHKILRLTKSDVAHVVYRFRQMRSSIFRDVVNVTLNGVTLCLNEIVSCRFVNEYTRDEFLTLA